MSLVLGLTFGFVALSLLIQKWHERLVFFLKSNAKYRILDFLADFIYYGPDIGVNASLALDGPNETLLAKRKQGQQYLESKLGSSSKENDRGSALSRELVDCRFGLSKVLMPLLRELEFQPKRNFVCELHNRKQETPTGHQDLSYPAGMHEVMVQNGDDLLYVGSDAVHTLGSKAFYEPIQDEINRKMSLTNTDGKAASSMLRFAPTSLNPELEKNANLILEMTNMDQVRYCLSGSEAMDAALKDVKASCRGKKVVVRFASAYHGHVSGVDFLNCGPNHLFLKECSQASLDFIEQYHYRIAAVVVNPMQHFTGINQPSPPGEKLTFGARNRMPISRDEYARWLHDLSEKCSYCTKYLTQVALIMDDVYFAFRTPELFSFNYFEHPETHDPLQPDVLVLGKGVAAGYPLSMVLGKRGFLNTYDKKYLLQVNKTVGTLSAWYGGLVASNIFLKAIHNENTSLLKSSAKDQLSAMVSKFDDFTANLNSLYKQEGLPVRIQSFSNTFSINYLGASLYNCRYPQYIMAEGVFLGNYSTGKFNLNADATEADLEFLANKFVQAAMKMRNHGYFEAGSKSKLSLLLGLARRFAVNISRIYYDRMMEDKRIDIEVSHNHPVNKFGHFWSSVGMICFAYPYIYWGMPLHACGWFLATHTIRQSGHFFYEHQDVDIEKLKFGHKDASKKQAVAFLVLAGLAYGYRTMLWDLMHTYGNLELVSLEQYVSLVALFTIVPHYVEITHKFGVLRGLEWMVKIWTDPFTDLMDFYHFAIIHPRWFLDLKDQKAVYKLDPTSKKVVKVE